MKKDERTIKPVDNLEFKKITWITEKNHFEYFIDASLEQEINFKINLKFPSVGTGNEEIDFDDIVDVLNNYPILTIPSFSIRSRHKERDEDDREQTIYSEWSIFNNLAYTPFKGIYLDQIYHPVPEDWDNVNQNYHFSKLNFWEQRKKVNDWYSMKSLVNFKKDEHLFEINFTLKKFNISNDSNVTYDLEIMISDEIYLSSRNSFGIENV